MGVVYTEAEFFNVIGTKVVTVTCTNAFYSPSA
jgi:hypothetical protein